MSEAFNGLVNPAQNPTLLPNFNQPSVLGPVVTSLSPSQLLAANVRVAASLALTLSSSVADDDVLNVVLSNNNLPDGSLTFSYTTNGADTLATLAENLAALVNSNLVAQAYGIYATSLDGVLTLNVPGEVGNSASVTTSVSPGSEVFTPSSGDLTGGSGMMIPLSNFSASVGLNILNLRQGQPVLLDSTTVANLVASGCAVM
jgi:hypothetical protein